MENKDVGFLIIGIAVVIAAIVLIFNFGLSNIVDQTCSHGQECTMYSGIKIQTGISLAIAAIVLIIGAVIMLSKPKEKIIIKKIREKEVKRKINYKLDKDEKVTIKLLEEAEGTSFQSDLVEKSGFSKVKMTRILDRLEGRQIIERKRRGMTNIVILK